MDAYGTIEPVDITAMEQTFAALHADKPIQAPGTHRGPRSTLTGAFKRILTVRPRCPRAPRHTPRPEKSPRINSQSPASQVPFDHQHDRRHRTQHTGTQVGCHSHHTHWYVGENVARPQAHLRLIALGWRVDFNLNLSSFEPNIAGVRNLINFALESKFLTPPRFIFFSTIAVITLYPSPPYVR